MEGAYYYPNGKSLELEMGNHLIYRTDTYQIPTLSFKHPIQLKYHVAAVFRCGFKDEALTDKCSQYSDQTWEN